MYAFVAADAVFVIDLDKRCACQIALLIKGDCTELTKTKFMKSSNERDGADAAAITPGTVRKCVQSTSAQFQP